MKGVPTTTADLVRDYGISPIYARTLAYLSETEDAEFDIAERIASKPRPFVKWVGGKRQLIKQFRELGLYPPEEFDPIKSTYYEPFAGGGAVFFDLLPHKAVLSDLNLELVTAYNVIKNDVESLIKLLKKHEVNKEYYLTIRALDVNKLNPVGVASRFIYLNRTGFNGLYRVNRSGQFNVPFGKNGNPTICDEDNLRNVSRALQHVDILHQSFQHVLKTAKKGDFIYLDPPYHPLNATSSFTSYTKESFCASDQVELRDTFVELSKRGCYVMLSNSDSNFINDIYSEVKGVRIAKIFATRSINSVGTGRGKIREVLVTNYCHEI